MMNLVVGEEAEEGEGRMQPEEEEELPSLFDTEPVRLIRFPKQDFQNDFNFHFLKVKRPFLFKNFIKLFCKPYYLGAVDSGWIFLKAYFFCFF